MINFVKSFYLFCFVVSATFAVPASIQVNNNDTNLNNLNSTSSIIINTNNVNENINEIPTSTVKSSSHVTFNSTTLISTTMNSTVSPTSITALTLSPEQQCRTYCMNATNELKSYYESEIGNLKNIVVELLEARCELNKGKWVPAENGTIPKGAIVSGWDPERPYWIARTSSKCDLVPCKLTAVHATCWMPWNNTEIRMNKYEVLVDADIKWIPHTSNNPIPKKAVIAGHYLNSDGTSEKLYIGREYIAKRLIPGYIYEFNRTLLHSTSFKNELKSSYEILIYV